MLEVSSWKSEFDARNKRVLILKILIVLLFKLILNKTFISIGGCYDTVKRNSLSKHFQFKNKEDLIYNNWINESFFKPDNSKDKTYYIPMPPPNITGKLHLGHATFLTIQDFLTRFYRKQDYCTFWQPGTDHAGLATHQKIIESLPSPENYTQADYFKAANKIKSKHQKIITNQMKKIGASCDWDQEQYTLSDNFINASTYALKKIQEAGLLYKKENDWYISMKGMALELINNINNDYFIINDEGSMNELLHMLNNIEDWCISRQILWGAKMPIYTHKITKNIIILSDEEYDIEIHRDFIREDSCFDTWFTSSLYPFASLGWPEKTKNFEKFYPANIIETGADILFFWCARMLMMGKFLTGEYPFKEIYLHGMCRDKEGRKMSKSLGNGIDPLDIIEKYGADALRFTILSKTTHKDIKLEEENFSDSFKFINKIWQSSRFFQIHFEKQNIEYKTLKNGDFEERLMEIKKEFIKNANKRAFIDLTRSLQHAFKHEFCDEWIENNKKSFFNGDKEIMQHGLYILSEFINMFHCIIPFSTQEIYYSFFQEDIITKEIKI